VQSCLHPTVRCINEFELIRKYHCADCDAVMMCACDERIGRKCLPHQLDQGAELGTRKRIPVTAGFQPGVCRDCRGLPVVAHPVAAIHGRTSKLRRYYWRELALQTMDRFADWKASADAAGKSAAECAEMRERLDKEVLEELRHLNATTPKYLFTQEPTQAEVLERAQVEVIDLQATYLRGAEGKRVSILDGAEDCGAEEYAARHFRRLGFETLVVESRPFHVLFGVFMWLVIQDLCDPQVRVVCFGDRHAFDQRQPAKMVWASLPEDFGTPGYGRRRSADIKAHLAGIIEDDGELEWLFDYWLSHSEKLRQYLWAHSGESIDRARVLIRIMPIPALKRVLRYLVKDYWGRYLGWPDLLVYRGSDWFFAEVKASGDSLSNDQKRWIRDNHRYLRLSFKLVKIHKHKVVDAAEAAGLAGS
jgi:VRR-NUC domain